MSTYLLDTTAFSALVKEHALAKARLSTLEATHRVVICSVVRGEVLYGLELMARGRKKLDLERKISNLLAILPCAAIPEEAADHYARNELPRSKLRGIKKNGITSKHFIAPRRQERKATHVVISTEGRNLS